MTVVAKLDKDWLVAVAWETEAVAVVADLIRRGVPLSQANVERVDLAWRRLNNLLVRIRRNDWEVAS